MSNGQLLSHAGRKWGAHLHRWQVEDLAAFVAVRSDRCQIAVAVFAAQRRMHLNMIRLGPQLQRVPFMAWLAAALLAPAVAPAASPGRFLQPVAGEQLAAVAAVLGQLVLQLLDPFSQLLDHSHNFDHIPHEEDHDRLFPLPDGSSDFFFGRNRQRIHSLILEDLCDIGNGKVQLATW